MAKTLRLVTVLMSGLLLVGGTTAQTTPTSVDAKTPVADGYISSDARTMHEYWWTSQFKASMRANPDSLRDGVYLRYYGSTGQTQADLQKVNDNIIRYGKHVPGLGTGLGLFEEFAKDARKLDGGIEQKKAAVAEIINRCPGCLDEFAKESYELLRAKKGGAALSADDKPYTDLLDSMVAGGKILDADSSLRALIERANPIDVQNWRSNEELLVLNRMSKASAAEFKALMLDDRALKKLITDTGISMKTLTDRYATDTENLKSGIAKVYQLLADERAQKLAKQQLDQDFANADASAYLIGTLLSLQSPRAAGQFLGVTRATLSAAKAIQEYALNPKTGSELVMAASVVGSVVAIVGIMNATQRDPESEYVVTLLNQIKAELESVKVSITRLDYRLDVILNGIARLEASSTAQFSALRTAIYELSAQLSDSELRDWQSKRESASRKAADTLSLCRTAYPSPWSWKKATPQRQDYFKTMCLLPLLFVADRDAVEVNAGQISSSDLARDDQIDKFNAGLGLLPNETWIPLLAAAIPRREDQLGADGSVAYLTGGEPYADDSVKSDVPIWHQAVSVYLELLAYVPDFPRTSNPEIDRLHTSVQARGLRLDAFLQKRLTNLRLEAAVESYRQSSEDLMKALRLHTVAFLMSQRDVRCSRDSLDDASKVQGEWRSRWLNAECSLATRSPGITGETNPFGSVEPPNFRVGGDILNPEILLFYPDVLAIAKLYATADATRSKSLRRLKTGASGWNSPDEAALLAGLRSLAQAEALFNLTASGTPRYSFDVTLPENDANVLRNKVGDCYLKESTNRGSNSFSEIAQVWNFCFKNTLAGCVKFSHAGPFDNFAYSSCGNFTRGTPTIDEDNSDGNNGTKTLAIGAILRTTLLDAVPLHLASAASLRDWGPLELFGSGNFCAGRPAGFAKSAGCGLDQLPTASWRTDFSSKIAGLDSGGNFVGGSSYTMSHQLAQPETKITELFDIGAMEQALAFMSTDLAQLRLQWLNYLKAQDSASGLRPLYARHNRAYAILMSQTLLTLQSSAIKSPALNAFISAPISGAEVAKSLVAGFPDEQLSLRLLLRDKLWRVPFPTVDRFNASIRDADELSCTPLDQVYNINGSATKIMTPRSTGDLPDEYGLDLYCQMWKAQLDRPKSAFGYVFQTNARLLTEGLEFFAGYHNDEFVQGLR